MSFCGATAYVIPGATAYVIPRSHGICHPGEPRHMSSREATAYVILWSHGICHSEELATKNLGKTEKLEELKEMGGHKPPLNFAINNFFFRNNVIHRNIIR